MTGGCKKNDVIFNRSGIISKMSIQAGRQAFWPPVTKLWKQCFAQPLRTKSKLSTLGAELPQLGVGRPMWPVPGATNLHQPGAPTTFSRLFFAGNHYKYKPPTFYALSSRCQSTSSTGSPPTDQTSEKEEEALPKLAPHFRTLLKKTEKGLPKAHAPEGAPDEKPEEQGGQYLLPHPIWSDNEVNDVEVTHQRPDGFVDWFAYCCVQTMRFGFDLVSGYKRGVRSEKKWLTRIIFLETVAGVPGMVAAMSRHLRSLRRLQRDHGWIHTLLEEAENERMHLMTALELRKPGRFFTAAVLISQGLCVNLFFLAYLCSPRFCHRFVGYLEEEAVITYTKLIKDLDDGKLPKWGNMAAPDLAIRYWNLKPDAMIRDMVLAIRADEAHHREVNHSLSDLKPDDKNPFPPGK